MPEMTRDGNIIQIGSDVRIEPGPALMVATASEELLGDLTADHYFPPRPATEEELASPHVETRDGMLYAKDALGKPIVIGEEMHFLNWVGFRNGDADAKRFYLYQYVDRPDPEGHIDPKFWREVNAYPTEDAAISAGFAIAGE